MPEIVAEEIKGATAKGPTQDAKSGLTGDDFESRLTRNYPKREYVVQYAETDLNFISRLMEHEGIFYFFEQGDKREKLIIVYIQLLAKLFVSFLAKIRKIYIEHVWLPFMEEDKCKTADKNTI